MSLRYTLLAAGGAAVVLMGVYLFVEVRAAPAPMPVVTAPTSPAPERTASRPAPLPSARPVRPVTHEVAPPPPTPAPPHQVRMTPSLAGEHPGAADVKLVQVMDEANKAYDMQDYQEAMDIAQKVLATQPDNIRMLRVMVSASCIGGDPSVGQKYFDMFPPNDRYDRDQMNTRCSRYGVSFKEHP